VGTNDTKSTGGGGFKFEDKVAAYFLGNLLAGQSGLINSFGPVKNVIFQARNFGWEQVDDLLVQYNSSNGLINVPLSIKSNKQFSAKAAPDDFVQNVWTLIRTAAPFNINTDYIGIVTGVMSQNARTNLNTLLQLAHAQSPILLDERISGPSAVNKDAKAMYESFRCPTAMREINPGLNTLPGVALQRTLHLEFDFEIQISKDEDIAIKLCTDLMKNGDGKLLWERLQLISRDARVSGGNINYAILEKKLEDFSLRGRSDIRKYLEGLLKFSRAQVEIVKDFVGADIRLRRADFKNLWGKLNSGQSTVLIGPSGVGKSSLAKTLFLQSSSEDNIGIWIPFSMFGKSIKQIEQEYSIPSFEELFTFGPSGMIIVLDGIDRLQSTIEFENLAILISTLTKYGTGKVHVLITCQTDAWPKIASKVMRTDFVPQLYDLQSISEEELREVAKNNSKISKLVSRPGVRPLLQNLKLLDIALKIQDDSSNSVNWVGESDLIESFWKDQIQSGPNALDRAQLMMSIAKTLADQSLSNLPMSEIPSGLGKVVEELLRDGFLILSDEAISFTHDLYGDWARQRVLMANNQTLSTFLEQRLTSPVWQRSIRLYSLHLIENKRDHEQWRKTLKLFNGAPEDDLFQDLFFDICLSAADQSTILSVLKEDLLKDDLNRFVRFLQRFLTLATVPNPQTLKLFTDAGLTLDEASSINRTPLLTYWHPIIGFLSANSSLANEIPGLIAQLCDIYLSYTPEKFPLRKEAADLAFRAAKNIYEIKQKPYALLQDNVDSICYQALMKAYGYVFAESNELLLLLIGRKKKEIPIEIKKTVIQKASTQRPFIPLAPRRTYKAWEIGPQFDVDRNFREYILGDSNSLNELIIYNPTLAKEIILALAIEEPRNLDPDDYHLQSNFQIVDFHKFTYGAYFRGPFLQLLRLSPTIGVETIVTLINFATDRWKDKFSEDSAPTIKLDDFTNTIFFGDNQVYAWYRDIGNCPPIISSALMAMEKWLYEQIEASSDIAIYLRQIVTSGRSTAFLGLLSAVARKQPSLFKGILKPLLTEPHLFDWETGLEVQSGIHGSLWRGGEHSAFANIVREWNQLDHRKASLGQWAQHIFITDQSEKPFFQVQVAIWNEKVKSEPQLKTVYGPIVPQFEISNYEKKETEEGVEYYQYKAPREIVETYQAEYDLSIKRMNASSFPSTCQNIINGESPMSPDLLENLQRQFTEVCSFFETEQDRDLHAVALYDCEAAFAAVVLLKVALSEKTEVLYKWAENRICDLAGNLPLDARLKYLGFSKSALAYDCFVAQGFATLIKDGVEKYNRIDLLLNILFSERQITVAAFSFTLKKIRCSAEAIRTISNLNFEVAIANSRWAKVKRTLERKEWANEKSDNSLPHFIKQKIKLIPAVRKRIFHEYTLKERAKMFFAWRKKISSNVKLDTYAKSWPKWSEIESRSFEFEIGLDYSKNEIDLRGILFFMKDIDPSLLKEPELVSFWADALKYLKARITLRIDDRGRVRGTPYIEERQLIQKCVEVLLLNNTSDLWKPLIDIANQANSWADEFFQTLYRKYLEGEISAQSLNALLSEVISYVSENPTWNDKTPGYYKSEAWNSILGINNYGERTLGYFTPDQVNQLLPTIELWVDKTKNNTYCLEKLLDLLNYDSMYAIRFKVFKMIIKIVISKLQKSHFDERVIESITLNMSEIWRINSEQVLKETDFFSDFKLLLAEGIKLQNNRAMRLSEKIP
jgi:GTPase SAR1 family protein